MPRRANVKSKKTSVKIIWTIIVILLVLIVGFGWYCFHSVNSMYRNIYDGSQPSSAMQGNKPFSVLLLGVDTGAEGRIDRGNSDTMIIMTVNPKKEKVMMYSIPRDTMAQMIGTSKINVQKINAAYNIGKSKMAMNTVSKLVNVPINYYVTVNMGGLEKMVNAVGGVDVVSPLTFSYGGYNFTQGVQTHLNGQAALAFTRMRHQDPRGDYGRQERQQLVLQALIKKIGSHEGLIHTKDFLSSLNGNIKTNLDITEVFKLAKHMHDANTTDRGQLQGQTAWINESSYQVASTANLQKASDDLRQSLDLKPETLNNMETKLNAKNKAFFAGETQEYNTEGTDTTYYTNNTY